MDASRRAPGSQSPPWMLVRCGGRAIAPRVRPAMSFTARLCGHMFRPPLRLGEGLWLEPCNAVHTAFCRGAMDVVFLAPDGRVLRVVGHLRPWRACACPGARAVLELAAGGAEGLAVGDRVERH